MSSIFIWDVFLSHSTRDKPRVRRLAETLRDAGLRVWFDEWIIQPGDDIYGAIEHGLEYTRTLILCMSQAAIDSDWVKLERNTTLFRDPQNKDRRFIPLLLEDCSLPAVIRRLAYLDWKDESYEVTERLVRFCHSNQKKSKSQPGKRPIIPPTGALSATSPLYIEREADVYAMAAAQQRAETLIIKAPRQMGKSSLLIRYLSACRAAGKQSIFLDLASICTTEEMAHYPTFLTLLAREIWDQAGQFQEGEPPAMKRQSELTKYIERALLRVIENGGLIAFDEMDRVLGCSYQDDFFSMVRFWHNQRADPSRHWQRLGLAIAISTEPYLFIEDVLRSPFNVGLQVELRLFNKSECQRLNRIYNARLKSSQLQQLMGLLNGHPHLVHLAFYALTGPNRMDFDSLIRNAATKHGPFRAHLRALENKLMDDNGSRAITAMKEVITQSRVSNQKDFYRLHSAGLVREDGTLIVPSNDLYARFFRDL